MIQLDIVTPTRKLISATCSTISIPGYKGELGILPEHTNLVTTVDIGVVKYDEDGITKKVAVKGGFAEISQNKIMLLVDQGLRQSDVKPAELTQKSQELDRKLVAAEVGLEEREPLFAERVWLDTCLQLIS